jgi:hypothetical protein
MVGGVKANISSLFSCLGSSYPGNELRPDCPYNFGENGSPA